MVHEFHITFALESHLIATQKRHYKNEFVLFAPSNKWRGNELLTNGFNSCVCVESNTVKLSPFQDALDMEFEDVFNSDTPELNIHTI